MAAIVPGAVRSGRHLYTGGPLTHMAKLARRVRDRTSHVSRPMGLDVYKEMREILARRGYPRGDLFGASHFDDRIFPLLEEPSLDNPKGQGLLERFRDVVSDPNNLLIERHPMAGALDGDTLVLHNGVRVYNHCYYDSFTDILRINRGVHEPLEERMFRMVLPFIRDDAVMIELGAYWAFYSIWFLREKRRGKAYCIEPIRDCLESGMANFALNGLTGDFTEGFVGRDGITMDRFCRRKSLYTLRRPIRSLFSVRPAIEYVDILHADIQGAELEMLQGAASLIGQRRVKYIFLSTHSDPIHRECMAFLEAHGYRIICSADEGSDTFSYDGFLLACPRDNRELPDTVAGSRRRTRLISEAHFAELLASFGLAGSVDAKPAARAEA